MSKLQYGHWIINLNGELTASAYTNELPTLFPIDLESERNTFVCIKSEKDRLICQLVDLEHFISVVEHNGDDQVREVFVINPPNRDTMVFVDWERVKQEIKK